MLYVMWALVKAQHRITRIVKHVVKTQQLFWARKELTEHLNGYEKQERSYSARWQKMVKGTPRLGPCFGDRHT
jgi:hypothetical protein